MAADGADGPQAAALIVVDFQEDFCPPNGALAVPNGRDIAPTINHLLSLPGFALRIATQDWHPPNHISFALNHPAGARPFISHVPIANPLNPSETISARLWPSHCVQDTPGAALVPELHAHLIDEVVRKGADPAVEMLSPFYAPFRRPGGCCDTGLAGLLRGRGVREVYVVGLAADYCVRCCAVDAVAEGFRTFVVEEGTRAVEPEGWEAARREMEAEGVRVVSVKGEEVRRLEARK